MNAKSPLKAFFIFLIVIMTALASSCDALAVIPADAKATAAQTPSATPQVAAGTPTPSDSASVQATTVAPAGTPEPSATPQPPSSTEPVSTPEPSAAPTSSDVTFAFTGDLMFHKQLLSVCKTADGYDFSGVLKNVAPDLQQADFAIANFEAPVMDPKQSKLDVYRFAAPPQAITDYAAAGFDVFTTANNHATDQGAKGLINTIDTIHAAGLQTTGTWRNADEKAQILMLEKNGVKIAILAYGRKSLFYGGLAPGMGQNLMTDLDGMRADAQRAKAQGADAVILCMHFGNEYTFVPTSLQKTIANEMRKVGVLAVIGSHPHVLQPMALDPDSKFLVAYSLGNLVTVTATGKRQFAAILNLTVHKDLQTGQVTISKLSYTPTWTRMIKGTDGKSHLQVYDIRQALAACQAGTDPELPKKFLNELTNGYAWIQKMLGAQYLDPQPN